MLNGSLRRSEPDRWWAGSGLPDLGDDLNLPQRGGLILNIEEETGIEKAAVDGFRPGLQRIPAGF